MKHFCLLITTGRDGHIGMYQVTGGNGFAKTDIIKTTMIIVTVKM